VISPAILAFTGRLRDRSAARPLRPCCCARRHRSDHGLRRFHTLFYAWLDAQPAAGLVRDHFGDPAAPIVFAAIVMASTVIGLGIFRRLER
jgi:hypothetical protein